MGPFPVRTIQSSFTFNIYTNELSRSGYSLSSMPTPSETYPQETEPWEFHTPAENVAGPSRNNYSNFSQAITGASLPQQDGHALSSNTQDNDGRTQLHRAAINGSKELVRKLLISGAAVNLKDHANNQPLHYAILGYFVEIAELLLEFGADFDSKGQDGRSPLHMSVCYKAMLEALLKRPVIVSCQDDKGDTPLHLAISLADMERLPSITVIPLLLDAGADINIANMAGVTPFHMIVDQPTEYKYTGMYLEIFLEFEPDISLRTRENKLPFEIFLEKSGALWTNTLIYNLNFQRFLSKGASLDIQLRSGKVLPHDYLSKLLFSRTGSFDLVKRLCKAGDPNKVGADGSYLLHAVLMNHRKLPDKSTSSITLLKIVLRQSADPNRLNLSGQSPLMTLLTTKSNDGNCATEAVKLLLAKGAHPMLRDLSGNLPIYEAIRHFPNWSKKIGKELLLADINLGDHDSESRHNYDVMDDQLWWQEWELASAKGTWDAAKEGLCNFQSSLPSDVSKQVCIIALGVLAGIYLQIAKDRYVAGNSALEEHRSHIASILRDCRKLELEVQAKWIDYVLGLCIS